MAFIPQKITDFFGTDKTFILQFQ